MPRDGSGIYSKASGSFVANTTIASAPVNADFDDLVNDANSPRPVTAGGTGVATAIAAHDVFRTLGTDIATASTLILDNTTGAIVNLTGTTTVTAVTLAAGKERIGHAAGVFTLTASATLVVNGSTTVPYTTAADDFLQFEAATGGLVRVSVISPIFQFNDGQFRIKNSAAPTKLVAFDASAITAGQTRTLTVPDASGTLALVGSLAVPQECRLSRTSNTVVTLAPFKGNKVTFPSGAIAVLSAAGVSATITSLYLNGTAAQTLTASTLYYVYLFNNGGTATLDFSTTGHSTDSATGIEIKTGDATRVLVGMVYPQAGPIFSDSLSNRLVVSWQNRSPLAVNNSFTANRSLSGSAIVEINAEIRCNFLVWPNGVVNVSYAGSVFGGAGNNIYTGTSLDGASANLLTSGLQNLQSGSQISPISSVLSVSTTEGFHYVTQMGGSGSGSVTWVGNGGGSATYGGGQIAGIVSP